MRDTDDEDTPAPAPGEALRLRCWACRGTGRMHVVFDSQRAQARHCIVCRGNGFSEWVPGDHLPF